MHRSTYAGTPWLRWAIGATCLALGGLVLVLATQANGNAESGSMLPGGMVAMAFGAFMIRTARRHGQLECTLHEVGLAFFDGRERHRFRWEDVERYDYDVTRGPLPTSLADTHRYRVELRDGSTVVLNDNIRGIEQFGGRMLTALSGHLLDRSRAALLRGEELEFGGLRLSRTGLHRGEELLPWPELTGIEVDRAAPGSSTGLSSSPTGAAITSFCPSRGRLAPTTRMDRATFDRRRREHDVGATATRSPPMRHRITMGGENTLAKVMHVDEDGGARSTPCRVPQVSWGEADLLPPPDFDSHAPDPGERTTG